MTECVNYDSPWKTVIEAHFPDCIAFYFPHLHAVIDWSVEPIFLEQELQQITGDSEIGTRRVDKLVDVRLKSGENVWLLIHIEIQRSKEDDFAKRMFTYHYRIFERFDRHPVSIAILTDRSKKWHPKKYKVNLYGSKLRLDFLTAKLLDYDEGTLLQSTNPFALVTLAQLAENRAGKDGNKRYETKLRLMRLLLEHGYSKQTIRSLLIFIDWILKLPKELEEKLEYELKERSTENKMVYESYFERKWKGIGREEGLEMAIQTVLESRFGDAPNELMDTIRTLNLDALRELLTFASVARELDAVADYLANMGEGEK